ncbi:MAG: chromate transporter [Clostridia bacterium]|nr:chromate transporter [Clostridia bacterium]
MIYLELFLSFFKTGLFAIGGGLATLPFLYEIAASHPDWFTAEMVADMLAVSESTPGPIGVNMATYAGYSAAGVTGAVTATLSLVLPSFLIILLVAGFMAKFRENRFVDDAFLGLRPAVVALISVAFLEVLKTSLFHVESFLASKNFAALFDIPSILLFAALLCVSHFFKKLHPIVFVLLGALVGIIFKF